MKALKAIALVVAGAVSTLVVLMAVAAKYEELSEFTGEGGGWNLDQRLLSPTQPTLFPRRVGFYKERYTVNI